MNRKIAQFTVLSMMSAAVSCTPDTPPVITVEPADPTVIVVNATTLNQVTRFAVEDNLITTKWLNGDAMGLYVSFKDELDASRYAITSGNDIEDGGVSADFRGDFKWKTAALPHTFYAYAPKIQNDEIVNGDGETVKVDADPTAIPISLPAVQTQDGYGSPYVSDYNFFIAEPQQVTAPRDFADPEQAKKVKLPMRSIFTILELRFASWENTPAKSKDVRIQKVTLTSDIYKNSNNTFTYARPGRLALSKGTVNITKASYDTGFAVVSTDEGDFSNSVTVNVSNPANVPWSERQRVIKGNKAREEFDRNVVYPVRMLVMANRSVVLAENEEERWNLKVEFTIDGVATVHESPVANVAPRTLRPGERHAIPVVLLTAEGATVTPPDPVPGEAWDGIASVKPVIDDVAGTINITTGAELKWFADQVNNQTLPAEFRPETPRVYDDYTLMLTQNINLGNKPWNPIGYNPNKTFRGRVEGNVEANIGTVVGSTNCVISGLNINPESAYDAGAGNHIGLFGRVDAAPNKTGYIKGLTVKGSITLGNLYSGDNQYPYVGGITGQSTVSVSGCEFNGTITATLPSLGRVGGITALTNSNITDCRSDAVIKVTSNGNEFTNIGGIVGRTNAGTVRACEFSGSIGVKGEGSIGGIIADNSSNVKACRNTGNLEAEGVDTALGGIVGVFRNGTIVACYNTGALTCLTGQPLIYGSVGGIVGIIYAGGCYIRACYSRGKVNHTRQQARTSGNIVGAVNTLAYGTYDYSRISYNYYALAPLFGDERPEMEMTSVMRFSASQWPQTSQPYWGTSEDGSTDGTLWNVLFPDSYGVEDWEYPQLYWEVIE